ATTMDSMVRWPMRMTSATVDLMIQGFQAMTGSRHNGDSRSSAMSSYESQRSSPSASPSASSSSKSNSGWSSLFSTQTSGTFDQDVGGDDLKSVIWSVVFTKPGYECVLQKQQEELINYSSDASSFAALRIAKFLEGARNGRAERPEAWGEGYPSGGAKGKEAVE